MASAISSMSSIARRIIGGLWKLPKSPWLVLVFSILLSLFSGYFNSSAITEYANSSAAYQIVNNNVVQPLLNNSTVKNIQVILNNSFKAAEDEFSDITGKYLIRYFNGVTLEEAVQSTSEIDAKAKEIVGSDTNDRQKAYLIYLWIAENLTYDNEKAEIIAVDSSKVASGAIVAYSTRTGVCFDYSCLYVAMCRAVDLKVRFLTGLGYTGAEWGDHAWNQVYDSQEDVWLNVDTTFGSSGVNYFDKSFFYADHKDGTVHGEW
jgi:transglutaminase-like putative cysteine protease